MGKKNANSKTSGGKEDASYDEAKFSPKPHSRIIKSEKGMTCMNWFFVIFLVAGATSACMYGAYEELFLKMEEKSMKQEKVIVEILAKISDFESPKVDQHQMNRIQTIQNSQEDIQKSLKKLFAKTKDIDDNIADFNKALFKIEQGQSNSDNTIENIRKSSETVGSKITDMESKITTIQDIAAVANENVKFLTKELMRLDKESKLVVADLTKSKNEIITLYADYVKRQGDDGVDQQLNGIKEQLAKSEMKVQLLEEQSATSVKHTHEEMTRFSGDISDMRKSMNDQMREMAQQVSMDIQTSVQTILKQIEATPAQNADQSKELESLYKTVSDLSTRVASFENSGELVASLNKLSSDFIEIRESSKTLQHSFDQMKLRSEKDISVLTDHIQAVEDDHKKIKDALVELQKAE